MSRHTTHDGARDDERYDSLAEALRRAVPAVPVDDVDWVGLHARISSAGKPLLAAVRPGVASRPRTRAWWQSLTGWSPHGIPLAAAATVLLMLAGTLTSGPSDMGTVGGAFVTIEEELVDGLSVAARPLLASDGTDMMLDAALFYDGEDW